MKRAFLRINEGMAIAEVMAIMDDEFAGEIPPYTSGTAGIQFTLDPNLARFNAEEITLYVSEGRVVVKEYWPD